MARPFQAAIFDVDGVLVDSPHQKAWRQSLRELMDNEWSGIRDQTMWSPQAFTLHVYQTEISGKPLMSGARAALDYFQVPDAGTRAVEYAARKQMMVVRLIKAGDFTAYPDALRFIMPSRTQASRRPPHPHPRTPGYSCARSGSTASPTTTAYPHRPCGRA